ncbi:MAG: chlorophyll synthesis pathway protein BchC [Caulobacterales bacterium]|jgi:3-hydroxyethyl bacteriochlorophyllide a dehydrogenase
MDAVAVVLEAPERLGLKRLALRAPAPGDVVVATRYSGVSTGTERLLYSGRMPPFPGMGYPLVPGYEAVGEVVAAGAETGLRAGEIVFVPGANCYEDARGLFGAAASHLIAPAKRVMALPLGLAEEGVLLALAATAMHALAGGEVAPDLIIGHGVLGRLIARIALAEGRAAPIVWETNPARRAGASGYKVVAPDTDERRDYRAIYDASGDCNVLDAAIARLAPGGEVVLAGFYDHRLSFSFPPAFMREARIRIAAEWKPADLIETVALLETGRLRLDGLITHHRAASDAEAAYRTAFENSACLKMVLDWKGAA